MSKHSTSEKRGGLPQFRNVGDAFANIAAKYPDRIALRQSGEKDVSYTELEQASRALAGRLVQEGIGPGDRVAISATRSISSVVGILAIVRAGAVYVPLDPAYPDSRLALMLSNASPRMILADAEMQVRLSNAGLAEMSIERPAICPLVPLAELVDPPEELHELSIATGRDDPIYVMYTSGTTGDPKGVVVPHRGVIRLVLGQDYCSLQPGEVILHLAPLAFDASTFEIWGALLNGGTLAIVSSNQPSTDDIAAALTDFGVTTAWLTAGLFHLMVDNRLEELSTLRQLLAGGDVLSPAHVHRFMSAAPHCRLINGYGPTENTTFTCCSTLSDGPWPSPSAPIGRAISGTEVFIVDEDLLPVADGEEGQLVAAGEGIALGYLGRDDLTLEKFVEMPEPIRKRVYLTGDLTRYLPDGQIEFLGRIDRQVKIDGKRIEPGEIEQALRACDGVRDAAVVVETTGTGVKRLLAFVATGPLAPELQSKLTSAVQDELRQALPNFLWPNQIFSTEALPITANGKVDAAALLALRDTRNSNEDRLAGGTEKQILDLWQKVLGLEKVGLDDAFFDLGGGSLQLMQVHAELQKIVGRKIEITGMFARPTIRGLAAWIEGREQRDQNPQPNACTPQSGMVGSGAIAIVGMTGRYPGARSIEEFWENQKAGKVSITHFGEDELKDWFDPDVRNDPSFVRARGVLDDPAMFDADLFGMYPREAELTDPQHRLFLEVSLEALEKAGIDPGRSPGPIGVFAGASMPTYLIGNVLEGHDAAMSFASNYQLGEMSTLIGSLPDALATRVAHKLDLHGPAITVLSACSTSAVAVVQACQSLQLGQCYSALAGGVSITFPQERGYLYQDGGMGSKDGSCRPLDADASGTVFGSGASVVVLKRLEDALSDRDHIYAVIRGFGINNDGAGKVGFTAPSAQGQASAIATAIANAHVDPSTIGYVELHGTATPLGDPIEFDGLKEAFGNDCLPNNCVLGSAKANIGHLDVAAGATGLIKAALCLHEGEIPPLANYRAPNPHIDFTGTPFRVQQELALWERSGAPRRAGVSSFGVGGTNVHIVLEEAPEPIADEPKAGLQILPLSAKTKEALDAQAQAMADHLESHPELALADVAYTLTEGRTARRERGAVVAENMTEAVAGLRQFASRGIKGSCRDAPYVVFMFPGQGSQYPGMGANLYRTEPVYREWIDRGADLLSTRLGQDLRTLLFELAAESDDEPHPIRSTVNAQPALFITQHALAQLWMSRGVRPDAMIGHSVGEFVAACLSGVMSFEDALALVARRAELMQLAAPGAMLAVRASQEELRPLLGPDLDIAAVNAPSLCVTAGPFEAIAALEARLEKADIGARRLHTSHAFHSAMMDPVVGELQKLAEQVDFAEPGLPYVSCVTGDWADKGTVANGAYWADHCRAPVQFGDALANLVRDRAPILIEVGPGRALSTFASQGLAKGSHVAITSMPEFANSGDDLATFYQAVARTWTLGAEPDWHDLYSSEARRVPLPAYQFQRKRYWIEPAPKSNETAAPPQMAAARPASVELPQTVDPESDASIMTAQPNALQSETRIPRLCSELAGLMEDLSGETLEQSDWVSSFLEIGFDSLFLGQVATKVQKQYGVKVTFRQLMADLPTIDALARHLDAELPPEIIAQPVPQAEVSTASAAPVAQPSAPVQPLAGSQVSGLSETFRQQLQAMQTVIDGQLSLMRGQSLVDMAPQPAVAPPVPAASSVQPQAAQPVTEAQQVCANDDHSDQPESRGRFRAFNPEKDRADPGVSDKQKRFIADLSQRYCDKMPKSKAQTQSHRPYFSDPRSVSGFRPEWKEMVFPVVSHRSKGSKIWDIDGNEFVDLVNGYGQTAFGHAPDFVQDAVARQLADGFAIGPQSPLAGEVAGQFSRMVGLDRVTFCNTGSEAVMAAMRLARCVTGREKVVVFNNDYHGQFDEVLVKSGGKASFSRAFPLAPGIPSDSVSNMAVLPYGSPEALDWIRKNSDDIAAVIVEPVQSRHPELRPFDFLRELRQITHDAGVAFVFDEVVTGFRTHPGGMQAVLGIKADMATYGKVVGGGMPVGILAGDARFMDALDGGMWQYGDESFPEVAPTFFAGTFVRHPLVLAACKAVLDHLEQQGPQLQENLAARTGKLVDRINGLFAERGVPTHANTFSSFFMLDMGAADKLGSLFYYHMRLLGVHVLEAYPCFLTTAHSDADLDRIFDATAETIEVLQKADIFVTDGHTPPAPRKPVPTEPREVPLTEPQLEILLSAQMGPEASCAFNESMKIEFDGEIDAALLSESVQDFIARHDAMRGTLKKGEPTLIVQPSLRIDIAARSADEAQMAEILSEEAETPFDLVDGPLVRCRILQLGPNRSALILTAHHIIFDGWSANVFAEELAEFYRARKSGQQPELGPVQSFADYATAKANSGPLAPEDEAYWLKTYASVPEPLALPGDRPRQATKTFSGATYSGNVDAELTKDVRKAGAKLGCTLFATLFGALQVTIGRLAESEDVVLGCPTAGQAMVEDFTLVGHCVNFLPIRAPFTMATPIGDHMRSLKNTVMEALDHQNATYGSIVRALNLPRDPNRTPLTDVQFNLERLGEDIDFATAKGTLSANPKAAVNFDLFFNMVESQQGLRIDVDYSTDLFDEETIARWIENLRQVLRAIVRDADVAIGDLDMIGREEREWLDARNPDCARLPDDCSIVSRFRETAKAHADSTALVADGNSMTYAELEAQSNRIARALLARGIGKGDFVALVAGRSIEAMVAILGIIKTGAAYAPLDPSYPLARQQYVLEDCSARLVIIGPGAEEAVALDALSEDGLSYADLFEEAASLPDTAPDVAVLADDPIYVMYTSGSTGKPKGVVIPHRGVVRLVVDQDYVELGPDQTLMQLTALGFDLCQFEIWGALLFGSKLAIVTQPKPSLREINDVIVQNGVTTALLAAALFHLIVEEGINTLAPLRQLVIGADVVSRTLVRRAQKALPHMRFVNGYGPTENSGLTTCYVFPQEGWGPGSSPIGQPINRSSAIIVDPRGKVCPKGVVGELWSGGEGVAFGYLGKPELTAERFVPHPEQPGETVYRTGDYARWRNDGAIEFLGRIDGQLKVNGMRVELDEIEAVLCEVEAIGEAAVTVRDVVSGGKTVHAFVTPSKDGTSAFDEEAVSRHIAERLPRQMHPKSVQIVETLPLNANGKVDRSELRKMIDGYAKPVVPAEVEAKPVGQAAIEDKIGKIWAEVLNLDAVSADDAIFDLGADSLQIFRIGARMAEQGMQIENRNLLANPTLSKVAALFTDVGAEEEVAAPKVLPLSAYRRRAMQRTDA